MRRTIFEPEHDDFRSSVRAFVDREIVPHHAEWEEAGIVPRELWKRAGEAGILGHMVPEEYGGGGVEDFRFNAIVQEELTRAMASAVGFTVHSDIVAGYLLAYATPEQKQRWLPGFCDGSLITAIAMTEPDAGSDLQGIRTAARRDGDHYVLNGSKTFISNGINADLVLVVCSTDPDAGAGGMSILAVERDTTGFSRGRNLDKLGMKGQDTAELFFDDARVPVDNLIGEEGQGFTYLIDRLPQERLAISVVAAAACRSMIDLTVEHVRTRQAFGRPIGSFQNTRFALAELETEAQVAQVFVDTSIERHRAGELTVEDAAMGKWWTTELQVRTATACLQLHGGYGYMTESSIARAFVDSRVQTIYGGTTEIMKEIIGRSLGL
jgi:alkylation response protein AidB-like acyl-CoA dehydrogenase